MASNDLQNRFAERIKKRQDDMAKAKAAGDDSSPSPTPSATSDNQARFAERITQRRSKLGMDVEVDDSFISSFLMGCGRESDEDITQTSRIFFENYNAVCSKKYRPEALKKYITDFFASTRRK